METKSTLFQIKQVNIKKYCGKEVKFIRPNVCKQLGGGGDSIHLLSKEYLSKNTHLAYVLCGTGSGFAGVLLFATPLI